MRGTVTIMVTDVDELGTLSGPGSPMSYMENGTMTVATYTVSGTMADTASWTLAGDDAEYFTLTGGVLTFKMAPDYEMPRGQAMSDTNTNTYMVTVKASAGGEMEMLEVTVDGNRRGRTRYAERTGKPHQLHGERHDDRGNLHGLGHHGRHGQLDAGGR